MVLPPPRSTLFPYTTLFRSEILGQLALHVSHVGFLWNSAPLHDTATYDTDGSPPPRHFRSEEHTSELQSLTNLVCRLLLEKKKKRTSIRTQSRHSKSTSSNI